MRSGVLALMAMLSCSSAPAAHHAAHVQLSKAEPSSGCGFVGVVEASSVTADMESMYADLQQQAAERGANYVVMDSIVAQGSAFVGPRRLTGRAFRCAGGQAACTPDCSPGFQCVHGRCVSACNPPCAEGYECGLDRRCRPMPPAPEAPSPTPSGPPLPAPPKPAG